jgi:hypothetical protein
MLSCFMVSGLSALGFAPNAPATGHPVCKRVTPTLSNDNSYPLSFQYICNPSLPSRLNRNAPILFPFILLQATSSPTGGYTPSPSPSSLILSRNRSNTGEFRPGRRDSCLSPITSHESPVTVRLRIPRSSRSLPNSRKSCKKLWPPRSNPVQRPRRFTHRRFS